MRPMTTSFVHSLHRPGIRPRSWAFTTLSESFGRTSSIELFGVRSVTVGGWGQQLQRSFWCGRGAVQSLQRGKGLVAML
ncbi:hypothetical protein MPTK1_8g07220 [Marchantia polymorpha subsp. ruderalis]|uniref:Uncharacterized protein n=1 Tax=Marchantia polymorpha TaxID=3197 RepID=A0A2R6XIA3_MARPO|nr:hypothetical protein MARPO_0013s0070 [Marchantia polymorpha]BBN19004.1 hypothetical protein Mp_8g07220 [Marchantia polymorpha subsp. ruderalis]|eukprot:PTQ45840.1 hypothetical protein MARPO_0013s0070 [Marchantia polymorpha]